VHDCVIQHPRSARRLEDAHWSEFTVHARHAAAAFAQRHWVKIEPDAGCLEAYVKCRRGTPGFYKIGDLATHGDPTPPTAYLTHDTMRDGHRWVFADPAGRFSPACARVPRPSYLRLGQVDV